jgi:hypothetical protein
MAFIACRAIKACAQAGCDTRAGLGELLSHAGAPPAQARLTTPKRV